MKGEQKPAFRSQPAGPAAGESSGGYSVLIAAEIGCDVSYRPVETDGAEKAASSIAELL
jgi:hypothetical protein